MNPPCAKCKKTVYPVEKLNCLDKIWHKSCFRCTECDLKLTMATYKGYNKLPYCKTHYPTTKFTQVADAVQSQSAKKSQNLASSIDYKGQHVASLGHFTQTADSVSTRHAMSSQRQASDMGYRSAPTDDYPSRSYEPSHSYQPEPSRSYQPEPSRSYQQPPQHVPNPEPPKPPMQSSLEPHYIAIYDYSASDDDEVSFNEGDIIVNVETIDEGWMTGTVERTGETGMLPSNYVELA